MLFEIHFGIVVCWFLDTVCSLLVVSSFLLFGVFVLVVNEKLIQEKKKKKN
jgi:hypothetical protein